MPAKDLNALFLDTLKDIYYAEKQIYTPPVPGGLYVPRFSAETQIASRSPFSGH